MIFLNIIFFLYCLIETVISDNNDSNATDDNLLEKLKLEKHLNTIIKLIFIIFQIIIIIIDLI